ncbi:MAG: Type IV secretion system protein virB5 precursor [Syntrophorhabdaceae bacterium PtaU1.Bin034]|jgi:type IV secretion system protein VirB5|nr:MAG: Type IV secretion system protein virB5 precursor [Syntrophorhabdaceae bacterium PtaU1.Bin034]
MRGSAVLMMLLSLCFVPLAHSGGVPVFDGANLGQQITNSIQQIAKMVEQINQMKMQYEQLQQTYNAMTGARNLGDILNNPLLSSYLPSDWRYVYSSINSGGYAGLTGTARAIRDANRIFDVCTGISDSTAKRACEREAANAAQHAAFSSEAYDKTATRLQQIKELMARLNSTTDQKAALEMIGRLSAEQAMIQNEATRLQLYDMLIENEQRLIAQQQKEIGIREMKRHGGVKMAPLDLSE